MLGIHVTGIIPQRVLISLDTFLVFLVVIIGIPQVVIIAVQVLPVLFVFGQGCIFNSCCIILFLLVQRIAQVIVGAKGLRIFLQCFPVINLRILVTAFFKFAIALPDMTSVGLRLRTDCSTCDDQQ